MYYPVEKWLSKKTDIIITINQEDYERAKSFKTCRIEFTPGIGVDISSFNKVEIDKTKKRKELNLKNEDFVLLSVGELILRKNHRIVLEALGKLQADNKLGNIQYVICGSGPLKKALKEQSEALKITDHVSFLGYRNDVNEICAISDMFIFMSLQEGLPVALMEAMACGLPIICSSIRGNTDLIHSGNGIICDMNADDIAEKIFFLMSHEKEREKLSANVPVGLEKYDIEKIIHKMRKIYELDK